MIDKLQIIITRANSSNRFEAHELSSVVLRPCEQCLDRLPHLLVDDDVDQGVQQATRI